MNEKDQLYLDNIIETIEQLRIISLRDRDDFVVQFAACRALEIIGEAAKQLSNDFREKNTHINWRKVIGLRNVLIHQYNKVDYDTVWTIIDSEIPTFREQLIKSNL